MPRTFPLPHDRLADLVRRFPTPFHLYEERGIRAAARRITRLLAALPGGGMAYYAVKALPNPFILRILASEGLGADCSSLAELELCRVAGLSGERIMFTSNETPDAEFRAAHAMGAILNLDDLSHVEALRDALGGSFPGTVSFRYNPGAEREGNAIIGEPEKAKYGIPHAQIFEAYARAKALGATRFGLHTMVVSNEPRARYHVETARMIAALAVELRERVGVDISLLNNGGGMGIPYRPGEPDGDWEAFADGVRTAYGEILAPAGLGTAKFCVEWGRAITGPYGWLVTRAIRHKDTFRRYIGVDASMADLMRPGIYGAYHHLTVSGKEEAPATETYDVVGSLCENCDKFAVARPLPRIEEGDLLCIHDTGAHGRAMGFNYNGKLRCGELLLREDGSVVEIRRGETLHDLFATLDLDAAAKFA